VPRRDRRSPRWRLHDYRREGLYFVTACTADRRKIFGAVAGGEVRLSRLGEVAAAEWRRTLTLRPYLVGDAFVVMPNHVHLLFGVLADDDGADDRSDTDRPKTGGRDKRAGIDRRTPCMVSLRVASLPTLTAGSASTSRGPCRRY